MIATPKLSHISFFSCDLYKGNTSFPLSIPPFSTIPTKNLNNGPKFQSIIKVSNFVQVIYAHLPNIFLISFTILLLVLSLWDLVSFILVMEFLLRGFGEVTLPLRALQAINQNTK